MPDPYQPKKQSQIDGTPTATKKCVDASTVMAIDRATVGRIRSTPDKIRREVGVYSRGITYGEAAEATMELYGVKLTPMHLETRGELRDLVRGGRGCLVSIHTIVTRPTSRRTNYFIGWHSVYCNDYEFVEGVVCQCELRTKIGHGEFVIDDPGTTSAGYLRWSADLVYRAAERRTGGDGINVLATRDTEGVARKCIGRGKLRAKPDQKSASKGPLIVDKLYAVIATTNGGEWDRDSGGTGDGWHRTEFGHIRGEALL